MRGRAVIWVWSGGGGDEEGSECADEDERLLVVEDESVAGEAEAEARTKGGEDFSTRAQVR